jgi:hypothetical protein
MPILDSFGGDATPRFTPWPDDPIGRQPSVHGLHTVFSAGASLYRRWQADLLAYSHRRVDQPGPLTKLLASSEQASHFSGRTFQLSPYSPHPLRGDDYAPYNKPAALNAWLREDPPSEEVVLLLDPSACMKASA